MHKEKRLAASATVSLALKFYESSFEFSLKDAAGGIRCARKCDAVRCNEFDVKHADAHPPDLPCFVLLVDLASAHGEREMSESIRQIMAH